MGRPALGLQKVNFFCDPTVLRALKWLAQTRGTSYSELVRAAVKEYIVREIKTEQADLVTIAGVADIDSREAANG